MRCYAPACITGQLSFISITRQTIVQFRFFVAIVVFFGSYLPLSFILLAQDFRYDLLARKFCWPFCSFCTDCVIPFRNPHFSLIVLVLCMACFLITLAVLTTTQPKIEICVSKAKHIPAELIGYSLPYVVSFMNLEYQDSGKFIGLIIFLAWMFIIHYRSGQIILNPLLIVFGWRLYEIQYSFPNDKKNPNDQKMWVGRAFFKSAR